jgi:RNA polymerase sigma-70 factor (ECF subfamily)
LTVAISDVSGVVARQACSRNAPSWSAAIFREFFEQTAPFVWRVLQHLGVRSADLPDICQEVFVVLHRRLPDFDERKSSLRTWTYGICLRTASQYRRRTPRRREVPEAAGREQSVMADQEDELERKRAREWLDRALEQVDDDDRAVFVLHEIEEMPMKEIAAVLGYPMQTGYSKLHRARDRVEKAFRALASGKGGR